MSPREPRSGPWAAGDGFFPSTPLSGAHGAGEAAQRAAEAQAAEVLGHPVPAWAVCPCCGGVADLDDPTGIECWARARGEL